MNWEKILLFFIILLCPLMHLLMMRGMHSGHKPEKDKNDDNEKSCH